MTMVRYRRSLRRRLTLLGVMEALFFLLMHFGRSADGPVAGFLTGMAAGEPSWASRSSCAGGGR